MRKRTARVFPALDLADEIVLHHRDHDVRVRVVGQPGDLDPDPPGRKMNFSISFLRRGEAEETVRLARGGRDGRHNRSFVGAQDVDAAVHHCLGRVDPAAVVALTFAEASVGERVLPSQAVPVVDVLGEDDHLRAGDRLPAMKALEHGVRGRAARAPFGGEQLDQHRGRQHRAHGPTLRGTFDNGYAILNAVSGGSGRLSA